MQPCQALSFLPGQWVDFFIPHVPTVGGFSFVSTPRQLDRCGTFELAVKRSRHLPAAWIHGKVGVAARVQSGEKEADVKARKCGAQCEVLHRQLLRCEPPLRTETSTLCS